MLINQTTDKLRALRLPAMAAEYIRQTETPGMDALTFDERIGMMTDAEWLSRDNNRIKKLTKDANLRVSGACFADIDYRQSRKLDRTFIARLTDLSWVKDARSLIITGATGTGKTRLACAFGAEACRAGMKVAFYRVSRLLTELTVAQGSGILPKTLAKLKKADILILETI
jgi:DNA replication protein DnaC